MKHIKKDFELIARVLAKSTEYGIYQKNQFAKIQHALMCDEFATELAKHNDKFDRVKFLTECNLPQTTIESI